MEDKKILRRAIISDRVVDYLRKIDALDEKASIDLSKIVIEDDGQNDNITLTIQYRHL